MIQKKIKKVVAQKEIGLIFSLSLETRCPSITVAAQPPTKLRMTSASST